MTKINLITGFLSVRMEKHWEIDGMVNDACSMQEKLRNLLGKALEERVLKQHIAAPLSRIKRRTNWGLFISLPVVLSSAKNSAIEKFSLL